MNNLAIFTKSEIPDQIAQKLQKSESWIVAASIPSPENRRMCEFTAQDFKEFVAMITTKAANRLGNKPKDSADLKILNRELNGDLLKFPRMTTAEIMKALENGLDGLYSKEPPVHFTPSQFVQWVRGYIEDTKKPVMKKFAQLKQQDATAILPEPTEQARLRSAHELFLFAVSNAKYEDYGNLVYMFLDRVEFLGVGKEEKWKAVSKAEASLKVEAVAHRTDSFAKIVKGIMEGVNQDEKQDLVYSTAKRLIVRDWLAEFRSDSEENQKDVLDMIQERVDHIISELEE